MRIEYIVVGFVLILVIFVVIITMLSGVIPALEPIMKVFGTGG